MARSSLETQLEEDKNLQAAKNLQAQFEKADLHLTHNVAKLNERKLDEEGLLDTEDLETRDPFIIASDVAAQISFFRKLKFQYLEQNAKDKYVKSIVSEIDDAPIVTAEDNKELAAVNEEKKAKLKVAKSNLAEVQHNIRTLAPLVEEDYVRMKKATDKATVLAQNILDAKLALARLRQVHPQPRLTIPMADQKLVDQVAEMQNLSDEAQKVNKEVQVHKEKVKGGALQVENLRIERAEVDKLVKVSRVEDEDGRLVPLYDWFTASLMLHRSIHDLHDSHSPSENELRLTYKLDSPQKLVTISLVFAPDTRQLADAQVSGLDEVDTLVGDVIGAHVQANDVHGLVSAVLARARSTTSAT